MKRFISLLISIPFILLIAVFASKNAEPVSVDLLFDQVNLPLVVCLLAAFFPGVVVGLAYDWIALSRLKKKYNRLEKKKETLQGLSGVLNKPDE
ncbi:MAG TPA: LapA family protein [Gammaproteobacteria bacterium]|nr:LapA family protein [Gammaproteobacteria bacterium]